MDIISFSSSVGAGTLLLAGALAIAAFLSTRRDKRYEIASGERDEWRERSERLTSEVHELELKVASLEGEVRRLEALPSVERLYRLIEEHDQRSKENIEGVARTLEKLNAGQEQMVVVLTQLAEQGRLDHERRDTP